MRIYFYFHYSLLSENLMGISSGPLQKWLRLFAAPRLKYITVYVLNINLNLAIPTIWTRLSLRLLYGISRLQPTSDWPSFLSLGR
jgi:hypothetical protein